MVDPSLMLANLVLKHTASDHSNATMDTTPADKPTADADDITCIGMTPAGTRVDAKLGAAKGPTHDGTSGTSVTPVGRALAAFTITTPTPVACDEAETNAAGLSTEWAMPLGQSPCANTVTLIPQTTTQHPANNQQHRRNRWGVPPQTLFNVHAYTTSQLTTPITPPPVTCTRTQDKAASTTIPSLTKDSSMFR